MGVESIRQEAVQNKVAKDLGVYKGWRTVFVDDAGNMLLAESLSWEIRWDYDGRTDGQPVYAGFAQPGTATTTESWTIQKFTYDVNNFVTRRQVVSNKAWDNRATAAYWA